MTKEDLEILSRYKDVLKVIIENQSVSKFDITMRTKIWEVLVRNNKTIGLCSKCNSNLISIAQRALELYNNEINNSSDERQKKQRKCRGNTKKGS